jgi:YbgC/YbaW family acyl-CoA thioester hydrolase
MHRDPGSDPAGLRFPFSVEVRVRGYELDSFGHANNSAYLNWIEHARWEMVRLGRLDELFGEILPVARHVTLDYRAETFVGEKLRITLWPRRVGRTSFTFGGSIHVVESSLPGRQGKLALLATVVLVCTRPGVGKVPVPESWRRVFPPEDPGPEPPEEVWP